MSDALEPVIVRERGRPTKYDEAYCEMIVGFGKEGMSKAEMANAFDVTRETLDEWAKRYPDFSDALHRAQQSSLAWWENAARKGLPMGSSFNAALWAKSMNGRFPAEPYRDRAEVSGPNGGPVVTASVDLSTASPEQLAALAGLKLGGE
jgi:hypothetical protein